MDEGCSKAVRETFCELYDKGLIYKGSRNAGHPEGLIALHPLVADKDVLEGAVHGMAHVELAGDVEFIFRLSCYDDPAEAAP